MTYYGGKELSASFRTVRKNTLAIAEEIPADRYDFKPAPEVRTVGQMLAHIAVTAVSQRATHASGVTFIDFEMFGRNVAEAATAEQALRTKEDIVRALREEGERFAVFLESASEKLLAETVSFPPPVTPSSRTRFEMLLATKEHEMHHRAQLMVYQRLLGIVPHLTRQRAAMAAAAAPSTPAARA
jgi:uncharacterized damage-inducible protein DinB